MIDLYSAELNSHNAVGLFLALRERLKVSEDVLLLSHHKNVLFGFILQIFLSWIFLAWSKSILGSGVTFWNFLRIYCIFNEWIPQRTLCVTALHMHRVLNFDPDPSRTLDRLQLIFISGRFLVSSCLSLSLLSLASSCNLFVVSNRARDNRFELLWYSDKVKQKTWPRHGKLCFVWWQKSCRWHWQAGSNMRGNLEVWMFAWDFFWFWNGSFPLAFLFFSFPVSYCMRTYLNPHLITIVKLMCRPETRSCAFIACF